MVHDTNGAIFGARPVALRDRIARQAEMIRRWARQYACLQVAFDQVIAERDAYHVQLVAEQQAVRALTEQLAEQRERILRLEDEDARACLALRDREIAVLRAALEHYASDESWVIVEDDPYRTRYAAADDGRWHAEAALEKGALERSVLEQAQRTSGVIELAAMRRLPARANHR
jgi:hypothetical protein